LCHREKCEITIESGGEFVAEKVIFEGDFSLHVPSGQRVTATMKEGKVHLIKESISQEPSWHWKYAFDETEKVILSRG